jgi:hypothetical protein
MDYQKLNQVKTKCKGTLTRALNSGDPFKVIDAVRRSRLAFDIHGWPDQWPTWAIAVRDLEFDNDPLVRSAARDEADEWH